MTYTTDQVSQATGEAADLVKAELGLGDRDSDLIDLVINAVRTRLDRPNADFAEIVAQHYSESADEIREWWTNWS